MTSKKEKIEYLKKKIIEKEDKLRKDGIKLTHGVVLSARIDAIVKIFKEKLGITDEDFELAYLEADEKIIDEILNKTEIIRKQNKNKDLIIPTVNIPKDVKVVK